ncbi:DUF4345 domain-containing protein [Amycolatopsis regifaucium]|uniref:DUF4345 domain-containing protein n=1 Tax=Amycolatopsis regifaucium TaxID=546365 RepID=A0A154MEY6_9PSEU|nr:DUF4345 domain-containing protein [Amycolatopsis regifaucium]KZB82139.1 hypothetical protein AVL48_09365 [Amycolatopsis regifaucium]OKA05790.1 DUF4345 domain-containing protein [Amycolatopsis regifaucium]SFG83808.1 protein of unknown function [Amycolatopsis regifaucium]
MAPVLIGLVAVFFLGMGLLGLIAPRRLIRPFGITLDSATARTEVRAVYGGFGVAIAVLLGFAAFDVGGIQRGVAIAVAVALAGMAFGRLVARFAERPERFYPSWLYFWVELVMAALLVVSVL